MSSTPSGAPRPFEERLAGLTGRQIAALAETFPGWRIERGVAGDDPSERWRATRRAPLTPTSHAPGLTDVVTAQDSIELVMRLAVQDEIARQAAAILLSSEP